MNRWSRNGVLDRVFEQLQRERMVRIRVEAYGLDSIGIKVHPADRVVSEDEIAILHVRLMAHGILRARPPPERPRDIRTLVVDIARLASFHPHNSQPLPGATMVWKGMSCSARQLQHVGHSRQWE